MASRLIRPATARDVTRIARIHRAARVEAMPWLPILHTSDQDVAYFAGRVLPSDTVLICDADGLTVGFIAFSDAWINHLYVAPGHWGQGHGVALLDMAKDACTFLQLWVFQGNHRARRFYVRQGFEEVELTDGQNNDERTPDVRLAWRRYPHT